jgi:bifunctional enzyme CysN/CysC
MAALVNAAGVVALVALVSPYAEDRANARETHRKRDLRFLEAYVETPLEICEARDPKGLYRAARAGAIDRMTGLDDPYERPLAPDLWLPGWDIEPAEVANKVVEALVATSSDR